MAVFKKLSCFNESIVDSYPTTHQLESQSFSLFSQGGGEMAMVGDFEKLIIGHWVRDHPGNKVYQKTQNM